MHRHFVMMPAREVVNAHVSAGPAGYSTICFVEVTYNACCHQQLVAWVVMAYMI